MSWKKLTLISLVFFTLGFLMIGAQNEINLIAKLGAITIFFSLLSPIIVKMWFAAEKTKTQKAVLGIFIVLFLYLLTMALVPPQYGNKLPDKSGIGRIIKR